MEIKRKADEEYSVTVSKLVSQGFLFSHCWSDSVVIPSNVVSNCRVTVNFSNTLNQVNMHKIINKFLKISNVPNIDCF